MKASDQAFVEDIMAEGWDPPPPAEWDRLAELLHELNTAEPSERDRLFKEARTAAGQNEAAHSLIERKMHKLGLTP